MNDAPPLQGWELPIFIRDLLGSPPKIGEGVNAWLYRVARLLHTYRTEVEIITLIEAATHGIAIRAGEIERAVRNSEAAKWQPGQPIAPPATQSKWPTVEVEARERILTKGFGVEELCEASPVWFEPGLSGNTPEILEMLFATEVVPDPLLCIGKSNADFYTRPLSEWVCDAHLSEHTLVVPSPMSKRRGQTKEGRESEHSLENTGPRRFLIVEFDQGSADEHSALLWNLATYAPLTMVVHSGGKSCHGWFFCQGQPEDKLRRFMDYAVSLGADRATWTRSQFVRLPDGLREKGVRQPVLFFAPNAVTRTTEGNEK